MWSAASVFQTSGKPRSKSWSKQLLSCPCSQHPVARLPYIQPSSFPLPSSKIDPIRVNSGLSQPLDNGPEPLLALSSQSISGMALRSIALEHHASPAEKLSVSCKHWLCWEMLKNCPYLPSGRTALWFIRVLCFSHRKKYHHSSSGDYHCY